MNIQTKDCKGLCQVYRMTKDVVIECLSFQVTFMSTLISFWPQIHKLAKPSNMTQFLEKVTTAHVFQKYSPVKNNDLHEE